MQHHEQGLEITAHPGDTFQESTNGAVSVYRNINVNIKNNGQRDFDPVERDFTFYRNGEKIDPVAIGDPVQKVNYKLGSEIVNPVKPGWTNVIEFTFSSPFPDTVQYNDGTINTNAVVQ
jgi:hypothetical protein